MDAFITVQVSPRSRAKSNSVIVGRVVFSNSLSLRSNLLCPWCCRHIAETAISFRSLGLTASCDSRQLRVADPSSSNSRDAGVFVFDQTAPVVRSLCSRAGIISISCRI